MKRGDHRPAGGQRCLEVPEFHPPPAVREIAATLERKGFEAWAVGGAVRDELLGRRRTDWDLATSARPPDVRRTFPRTIPVGIEHGTVGVIGADGKMYEVTTFRRDIATDGRHAVIEFSDSVYEDLARRDFTINALGWRPATGDLADPHGGRQDLSRGLLRAVGDPARRFAEDYLRVLRGLRFAGSFQLEIEAATGEALRRAVPSTRSLSAERVREELEKVLAASRPSSSLRLYAECGVLQVWYPEVARADGARREIDLAAVDALPPARRLLRLVRWLAAIAEIGEERAELTEGIMERLRFPIADTRRVARLVLYLDPLPSPTDSDAEVRHWLARVGAPHVRDIFRLHFATARARAAEEETRLLLFLWDRVHGELWRGTPLRLADLPIDGRDLLARGVDEGPAVGVLLDELFARVLDDPALNERSALLQVADELIRSAHLSHPDQDV